jgi:Fe-S-cluster containining protein
MTEALNELLQCMKGTNQPHPRCVCLEGKIGKRVSCTIYPRRSSTCRDFGLHETKGVISVTGDDLTRCNEARKAWGLPPLTRWQLRNLQNTPMVRHRPGIPRPVRKRNLI